MGTSQGGDPYSRLDYRRRVAWPARIEREWPFLEREFGRAPESSVIDLGCGTGEHARHFASQGYRAVGIDRSSVQIETAREYEAEFARFGPLFICGELSRLAILTDERFGAATCLGNVLPHLDEDELSAAVSGLSTRLHCGGRLLIQLVNYEGFFRRGVRHLPLNLREDPEGDGEIVFLRLLEADGDSYVKFFPSTLRLSPGADPPLRVETSKEVRLRAWRLAELDTVLERHGFRVEGIFGDMERSDFDADLSSDLVLTAVLGDAGARSTQHGRATA
jgi:SAM-dependent methyltransferase